jgi:hypothetical protein
VSDNPNIAKLDTTVTEADIACANRCIPPEVIFADHEDHVTDLRRRAANAIAAYRVEMSEAAATKLRAMSNGELWDYVERWTANVYDLAGRAAPGRGMNAEQLARYRSDSLPTPAQTASGVEG